MKRILLLLTGLVLAQSMMGQNAADFVGSSIPAIVPPGATFDAIIGMQNTGTTTWTTGHYALAAESPRSNTTWLATGRAELPANSIAPGEIAVFETTFTAPTTPGIYNFAWRMVQDATWFGPMVSQTIRVGAGRFTPGDVVLMQSVPTANDALSANGTALVLNNFSLSSLRTTFRVALPITGPDAFVGGSSPFSGMIDLSTEGSYVVVGGFNATLPSSINLETSTPASVPRAVGTVNSAGQFVLGARANSGIPARAIRGVASDGKGNFWSGGVNNYGIYYYGTNSAAVTISPLDPTGVGGTAVGATRNTMMVNGRPYFSTSQFPTPGTFGIGAFPSVAPTSPEEPTLVLNTGNAVTGGLGTASPKGFYFNTNLTIGYIVDLRPIAGSGTTSGGGIYRYNGTGTGLAGSWTYAYTLTNSLYLNGGAFQDVIADFSGANPKIYATAGASAAAGATNLVSATDTGAATTKFTILATAPAGTFYRGLSFAPRPASLSITQTGTDITVRWNGGGVLYSANDVTGPYSPVDGSPTSPYTTSASTAQFYAVGYP